MSGLPERYDSALHLPFNRACLEGRFVMKSSGDDPGGAGFGVLLHNSCLLVDATRADLSLPWGDWTAGNSLYLGDWQGQPCRLVDLGQADVLPEGLQSLSLLQQEPQLSIDLLSIGGLGRMLLYWQDRSRYCGVCGMPMAWLPDAWGRHCSQCQAQAYPAIHPCAIVLVTRPGEVLLTRKANWAPGRYSLVAGFQELGEALEETAAREVLEETGVQIGNIRYVGSQCWPFPSQVMVGFVADYLGGELTVDKQELDDARWFAVDRLPVLPPKRSIARYIIDSVLDRK